MKSAEEWVKTLGNRIERQRYASSPSVLRELIQQIQLDAYKAGMTEACKVVQKRADDYDDEHGHTDLETGTREYPKNGDDYMLELTEIIESIATARDKKENPL